MREVGPTNPSILAKPIIMSIGRNLRIVEFEVMEKPHVPEHMKTLLGKLDKTVIDSTNIG